jgi:GT2 family glycosyltransferase
VTCDEVTTVVITHNRRDQLAETLPRHEGDVIVVDNGSSDGTVEVVRQQFPQITLLPLGENIGAAARTEGVKLAKTQYVAFADDDSWWSSGALERAVQILGRFDRLGLLTGRVVVEPARGDDPFNDILADSPLRSEYDAPGTPVLGFMACAAIVRRSAFLEVGGFHPAMGIGGEEQLLSWDLAARGWQLRYVAELVAHHEPRANSTRGAPRAARLRRNAVLMSILRRPWPHVLSQVGGGFRGGPAERRGVWQALPMMPMAMAQRHRLPAEVERQLELLSG